MNTNFKNLSYSNSVRVAIAQGKAKEYQKRNVKKSVKKQIEKLISERNHFSDDELKSEEWRNLKEEGFEHYQVSNLGRIRNSKGQILRPYLLRSSVRFNIKNGYFNNIPYCSIRISSKNKVKKSFYIHRLVAHSFIDNPFKDLDLGFKYQINHKDKNPLNNRVSNLEYCSPVYNNKHYTDNLDIDTKEKKFYDLNYHIKSIINDLEHNEDLNCKLIGDYLYFSSINEQAYLLCLSRDFVISHFGNSKKLNINYQMCF